MSMKMDATSNDRESLTARYTIAANIVFSMLAAGAGVSSYRLKN